MKWVVIALIVVALVLGLLAAPLAAEGLQLLEWQT
jgi:hypothetical protein